MLNVPINVTVDTEVNEPSKTYSLDYDTYSVGSDKIDGIEAVKQAISKALSTPRFKCRAYDNQYGSEIREAITEEDASDEYIADNMTFLIEDTLKVDDRVLSVSDVSVEHVDDILYVSFSVSTIFGDTTIEEEI